MTIKKKPAQSSSISQRSDRPSTKPIRDASAVQPFPNIGVTLRSYSSDKNIPSTSNVKNNTTDNNRRKLPKITPKRAVITIVIVGLLAAGWFGGRVVYNLHKVFGGNILNALHPSKLHGEDRGRVNILLAGNSADDVGHDGGELTDSILILSVDTKNNSAFILSVPRDLWVKVPGDGHYKINYAYVSGKQNGFKANGLPSGGMGQLEQIIQQDLGINIDYYALIDYNALKQAVDAVGGIDFTVKSVDKRGLYDPNTDYTTHGPLVKLTNGVHHLNGQQALDLARARGDAYNAYGFPQSDFDRTEHQRQLLVALKTKAVSAGVVSNPSKLASLSDVIGANVKTDLSLSSLRRLYDIVKIIDTNKISSLGFNNANGRNLLANYQSSDGQSALAPAAGLDNYSALKAFILQQTSSDPVVREGATIAVLNATDTSGLAAKKKTQLENLHLTVSAIGSAFTKQAVTTIIDTTGGKKPGTATLLKNTFLGSTVTTTNPYDGTYDADFIVLIGADQIPKSTQSTGASTNN